MLGHKGTLNTGFGAQSKSDHPITESLRRLQFIIFANTLPSVNSFLLMNNCCLLSNGHHGFCVQLNSPDGFSGRAPPVKVDSAVIVLENGRIPEFQWLGHLNKRLRQRIVAYINATLVIPVGCTEYHLIAHHMDIRGVVIHRQLRSCFIGPVHQVL